MCPTSADSLSTPTSAFTVWPLQAEALRYLVEHGVNLNHEDNSGRTAVHEAARNGQVEVLQLLKKLGCDMEHCDNEGETPLDLAKGDAAR